MKVYLFDGGKYELFDSLDTNFTEKLKKKGNYNWQQYYD